jgi:hypothetical protein
MPFPNDPAPWCFYRLGPAKEKDLFKRRRETYDGVIVPAHIASYYSAFCAEFIGSLQKPYLIDPMTYLFAGNPALLKRFIKRDEVTVEGTVVRKTVRDARGRKKKGDLKRSFSKLVGEGYAGLIGQAVSADRPLVPGDFAPRAAVDDLIGRVVDFQTNRLSEIPEKYRKYGKYAKKYGKPLGGTTNPPMCIVPPYFALDGPRGTDWLAVNVDLAKRTKSRTKLPVFPVILASSQLLTLNGAAILSEYIAARPDGYLLWVDGFSGDQDVDSLRAVYSFVNVLSKQGQPVILLYGDAYSLVLHFAGLRGFACGICYAQHKVSTQDVDVEGLIPPRYYVRLLKKKIRIETEARRVDLSQYAGLQCACEICRRKPDPRTLDDTESREHFMLARRMEVDALRTGVARSAFASELNEAYAKYDRDPVLRPVGHLRNWAAVLTDK